VSVWLPLHVMVRAQGASPWPGWSRVGRGPRPRAARAAVATHVDGGVMVVLDRWRALALSLFAYQGLNFCDKCVPAY
jgi:hypothetical protein